MIKWLEITADYTCNNRCVGCFSVSDDGRRMPTSEAFQTLRRGRAAGAEWLWLGGGEPTTRRDLFAIVAEARRLGFTRIKLQTNGMMLSYPEYARRCVDAGVTEVNFAIKGSDANTHDRLTRTPGCFDLMTRGISECRDRGLPMDGDILLYRSNLVDLPEMIRVYTARGLSRFNLWLLWADARSPGEVTAEVPRIAEVAASLELVAALGLSARPDFVSSLHTPPCTLPAALDRMGFNARDLDLLVANPGGYMFRLETSPIEGGLYFERCTQCDLRSRCGGVRRDYVALYGDAEFQPVRLGRGPHMPLLRDAAVAAAASRATRREE